MMNELENKKSKTPLFFLREKHAKTRKNTQKHAKVMNF